MDTDNPPDRDKKDSWLKIALIVICVACLTSVLTIWLAKLYLFPKEFKPIRLNAQEEQVLDNKIKAITADTSQPGKGSGKGRIAPPLDAQKKGVLTPEKYSEANANREIRLTERELNGLLAKNTDMAKKLAINLSDDLASAKLLIPLDPEFPFIGGKTLKVTAGMELRYSNQRPVAILRGVSIWGVPIPNEWLGGIKNIDLFREFGMDKGFWHTFAAGVDDIHIEDGKLTLRLKP
jgi:hypothetical protein